MRQLRNFNGRRTGGNERSNEAIVSEAMQKYGNLNENELMKQLQNKVEESKRNGTFNPGEVLEFASRVSPMLDEKQREKLANLLHAMGCE